MRISPIAQKRLSSTAALSCLTRGNAGAVRNCLVQCQPQTPCRARVQLPRIARKQRRPKSYQSQSPPPSKASNHALPLELVERLVHERRRGPTPQEKALKKAMKKEKKRQKKEKKKKKKRRHSSSSSRSRSRSPKRARQDSGSGAASTTSWARRASVPRRRPDLRLRPARGRGPGPARGRRRAGPPSTTRRRPSTCRRRRATTSAAATSPTSACPTRPAATTSPRTPRGRRPRPWWLKERRAACRAIISGPTRSGTSCDGRRTSSTLATRTARGGAAAAGARRRATETGRRGATSPTGACPTRRARPT